MTGAAGSSLCHSRGSTGGFHPVAEKMWIKPFEQRIHGWKIANRSFHFFSNKRLESQRCSEGHEMFHGVPCDDEGFNVKVGFLFTPEKVSCLGGGEGRPMLKVVNHQD